MKAIYNSLSGLDLTPTTAEEATMLDRMARASVLSRRYILSAKQTPGLGYDDRLQVRLGIGRTKAYQLIAEGQLQTRQVGGKHIISETAVLRFLDPQGFAVQTEVSDLLAA